MRDDLTPSAVRAARLIAMATDLLQIGLLPVFFPGGFSPANNVIDVVVAAVLLRLLGWHWAFLPTFVVELVPFVDLVPTWTAAVFLATRGRAVNPPPGVVVEAEARPAEEPKPLPGGPQPPLGSSGA
ncbi:MAG TPA: hypothetical protein VMX54_14895 [Vicinamibacteria bacterium]|nr:hypothetical protein [Vicinamibacteria bacterium]